MFDLFADTVSTWEKTHTKNDESAPRCRCNVGLFAVGKAYFVKRRISVFNLVVAREIIIIKERRSKVVRMLTFFSRRQLEVSEPLLWPKRFFHKRKWDTFLHAIQHCDKLIWAESFFLTRSIPIWKNIETVGIICGAPMFQFTMLVVFSFFLWLMAHYCSWKMHEKFNALAAKMQYEKSHNALTFVLCCVVVLEKKFAAIPLTISGLLTIFHSVQGPKMYAKENN